VRHHAVECTAFYLRPGRAAATPIAWLANARGAIGVLLENGYPNDVKVDA